MSFSPSDHESDDGEMGCMVNLLNEDGALKAITLSDGEVVGEIPSHCRIVKAHKNSGYSHWILDCVEDDVHTWKWTQMDGTGGGEFDLPEGFEPNDVATIGNVVCFVGDSETVYALWKDGGYVMFSLKDFNYSLNITNPTPASYQDGSTTRHFVPISGDPTNFIGCFAADKAGSATKDDDDFWDEVSAIRVTANGGAEIWTALDAALTAWISGQEHSERFLRHTTLGIAAVRLYDGSLINVSDIFVLCEERRPSLVNVQRRGVGEGGYVNGWMSAHCHDATVTMNVPDRLKDIIQGVDIYLTTGDQYIDRAKVYDVDISDYISQHGTSSDIFWGHFTFDTLSGEKLYEAIDREVFCLMKTVKPDEMGTPIHLERVTGAEEAMTLSDLRRGDIGGKYCYAYNNRLHLAVVKQTIGTPMVPRILQEWPSPFILGSWDVTGAMYDEMCDLRSKTGHVMMDAVMEVRGAKDGTSFVYYFNADDLHYPFGPIVSVPYHGAKELTMYIKVYDSISKYYKKTMKLHESAAMGCAYYVDEGRFGMRLCQTQQQSISECENHIPFSARGDWEDSTMEEFYTKRSAVNSDWDIQDSIIKLSEVNNPLVFPVGNTVRVGAGKILGMATNTEPISEGQFGVAPLYAFTDEGVWPLSVSDTGTYSSLGQPSSRDVVTDAGSITPIDKGVLFATKRGVMIIRGNQTESLTDSLNGIPWDFTTLPHHDTLLNAFDASIVGYQRMEDFMPGSRMIYDYVRERVYLYRDDYDYALVLSLRTGLWGAAEKGGLQGGVPWYPETYILRDIDGKREIVNTSAPSDPTRKVDVLCCTRPLSLGAREIHKSVMHAVVRGLAHMRGSGEASRLGCAIYGSNDLYHWFAVNSSTNQYLRGRYGQPYKWWRIAIVGSMDEAETIDGVTMDVKARLNNRLR